MSRRYFCQRPAANSAPGQHTDTIRFRPIYREIYTLTAKRIPRIGAGTPQIESEAVVVLQSHAQAHRLGHSSIPPLTFPKWLTKKSARISRSESTLFQNPYLNTRSTTHNQTHFHCIGAASAPTENLLPTLTW